MKKYEVISRLCDLSKSVAFEIYGMKHPADCFCRPDEPFDYAFSDDVLSFIENAVEKELKEVKNAP